MRESSGTKPSGSACAQMDQAAIGNLSDGQLLDRFIVSRDKSAFEELLRRHGPLVLGVCRRILADWNDADDAFQTTFLVLLQKARAIRRRESVGCWLYGVACRIALKANTRAARRRLHEKKSCTMSTVDSSEELIWRDLRPVLDQEIAGLPEKCRAAVVLCDLQGLPYSEAAHLLGCSKATISLRLTRAREMLRERLSRREVVLSVGLFLGLMGKMRADAAVPGPLQEAATRAAVLWAEGQPSLAADTENPSTGTGNAANLSSAAVSSSRFAARMTSLRWAKSKIFAFAILLITVVGGSALATYWFSKGSLWGNTATTGKGGKKTLPDRLDGLPPKP